MIPQDVLLYASVLEGSPSNAFSPDLLPCASIWGKDHYRTLDSFGHVVKAACWAKTEGLSRCFLPICSHADIALGSL